MLNQIKKQLFEHKLLYNPFTGFLNREHIKKT